MYKYLLEVAIANGKNNGQRHFIPKFSITPSDLDHPIELTISNQIGYPNDHK